MTTLIDNTFSPPAFEPSNGGPDIRLQSVPVSDRFRKAVVRKNVVRSQAKTIAKTGITNGEWTGMIAVGIGYAVVTYGLNMADLSFAFGYGLGAVVNLSIAAWVQRCRHRT